MSTWGHTFVVQTDITKLACDVLLLPTDAGLGVTRGFRNLSARPSPPPGWGSDGVRVTGEAHEPRDKGGRVTRWVNVGIDRPGEGVKWLLKGTRDALEAAGKSVNGKKPANNRVCPLVALPLLGTGRGGFGSNRGDVLDRILTECNSAAARNRYDVVIACRERSDYAALQSRRFARPADWFEFPAERPDLMQHAERLAGLSRGGQLVLFLGAGVGESAGLPSWDDLIKHLAAKSSSYRQRAEDLQKLPAIDAAGLLKKDLAQGFSQALKDELTAPLYAVGHALLASLRATEAITTNFDVLYEQACRATSDDGQRLLKLPWEKSEPGRPWLLKMHGDIDKELVLTRDDYLRYDAMWRPLASMVQTAMMIRHVLFVGYSLRDDNFVRLGRDVSLLLSRMEVNRVVGTVLTLGNEPMLTQMWEDLQLVPMGPASNDSDTARRLEVFLDCVAMHAASEERSYYLDPRYENLMDEGDISIIRMLRDLGRTLSRQPDDRWRDLAKLLKQYGYGQWDHL